MGLTPAERNAIRLRHVDLEQDPLPRMPKPKSTRPIKPPKKLAWSKVRRSRRGTLPPCMDCISTGEAVVERAVWERQEAEINGGDVAHYCKKHAEPRRRKDGVE